MNAKSTLGTLLCTSICIGLCLFGNTNLAQTPKTENEKAFLRIELDFNQARSHQLFKKYVDPVNLYELEPIPVFEKIRIADLERLEILIDRRMFRHLMTISTVDDEPKIKGEDRKERFDKEELKDDRFDKKESDGYPGNHPSFQTNRFPIVQTNSHIQDETNRSDRKGDESGNSRSAIPTSAGFNCYLKIVLTNKAAMEQLKTVIQFPETYEVEKNGNRFLKSRMLPKDLAYRFVGEQTFEFGTDAFLLSSAESSSTSRLSQSWRELSDGALKVGIDIKTLNESIVETEMIRDADLGALLEFLKPFESIGLSVNLKSNQLVNVSGHVGSEESAKAMSRQFNQQLGLMKRAIFDEAPLWLELDGVHRSRVDQLLESLTTKANSKKISLNIVKPEGLEDTFEFVKTKADKAFAKLEKESDFRNIGISIHDFHDSMERTPFVLDHEKLSKELSWRVHVLRYLDHSILDRKFEFDQAWNSEVNRKLLDSMPSFLGKSKPLSNVCWIKTFDKPFRLYDIEDPMGTTIMLMEYPQGVKWTENKDLTIEQAIGTWKKLKDGETLVVATYDCSVYRISNKMSEKTLRALLSTNGKEEVSRKDIK